MSAFGFDRRAGAEEEDERGSMNHAVTVETQAKGKGRVRPRQKVMEAAKLLGGRVPPVIPRLTAMSHKDAVVGERVGDPRPRYPEKLTDGNANQIPKFRCTDPVELNKAVNRIRQGLPTVLSDCPVLGDRSAGTSKPGLFPKWNFDYLVGALGDAPTHDNWSAMVSETDKHRFIPYNEGLNVFGSYYHVREPETERMQTSFVDFVKCARTWTARRIYLRAVLMSRGVRDAERSRSRPECIKHLKQAAKDLEQDINWDWLNESLLEPARFGGVFSTMLLCGMRDALLPAQYTGYECLQAQLKGRRRVVLVDPAQTFKGMYPYPCNHTYDRQSMVDLEAPNYDDWPQFAQVKGTVCILEPGDVLYTPMWWWRHVQDLEDEGIALELAVHQGQRVRTKAMVPLPLGRVIEERITTLESLRDAKHWLGVIARAEEADYIDLSTVKGHKRIMMIQDIRDEVDNALGMGSWQEFLHTLIDRRLDPTPWLNVNFREPLYLKDVPVQHDDTRNELEQKFPEFFYNKLSGEGYNVQRTPMSVLNPQHPDFLHKDNPDYQSKLAQRGPPRR